MIDPRSVLEEFGLTLADDMKIRVGDFTAELRYLVVPKRPAGTEGWDEARLATLSFPAFHMIGTALAFAAGRAMNGPHDLGGQLGFGANRDQKRTSRFSTRVGNAARSDLTLAAGSMGHWSIDESRHARESLYPAEYYSSSYYRIWISALETLLVRHGFRHAGRAHGTGRCCRSEPCRAGFSRPRTFRQFWRGRTLRSRYLHCGDVPCWAGGVPHREFPSAGSYSPSSVSLEGRSARSKLFVTVLYFQIATPTAAGRIRQFVYTVGVFRQGDLGRGRRPYFDRSRSMPGKATLKGSEQTAPLRTIGADEPNFTEPWEAEAFAMAVALHEGGLFSWEEWTQALSAAIAELPSGQESGIMTMHGWKRCRRC